MNPDSNTSSPACLMVLCGLFIFSILVTCQLVKESFIDLSKPVRSPTLQPQETGLSRTHPSNTPSPKNPTSVPGQRMPTSRPESNTKIPWPKLHENIL